ncbi:MAG: hypothetical protein ACRDHD_06145 [Candidatus Limnocylindria bacterium]
MADRRAALRSLGATDDVFAGLAALTTEERAALIASAIEQFGTMDVETILGREPTASHRLVQRARRRYLDAVLAARSGTPEPAPPGGVLATRIGQVAARTLGGGPRRAI